MLPAISAEDCLFADVGIDPAMTGCQSYEATDFMINGRDHRHLEHRHPLADRRARRLVLQDCRLRHLVDAAAARAPARCSTPAITRRSSTRRRSIPAASPTIRQIPLFSLPWSGVTAMSTLCIPPARVPAGDPASRPDSPQNAQQPVTSSMAAPETSVVIPTRNEGAYLAYTVHWILANSAARRTSRSSSSTTARPTSRSGRSSISTAAPDACAWSPASGRDRDAPAISARAQRQGRSRGLHRRALLHAAGLARRADRAAVDPVGRPGRLRLRRPAAAGGTGGRRLHLGQRRRSTWCGCRSARGSAIRCRCCPEAVRPCAPRTSWPSAHTIPGMRHIGSEGEEQSLRCWLMGYQVIVAAARRGASPLPRQAALRGQAGRADLQPAAPALMHFSSPAWRE